MSWSALSSFVLAGSLAAQPAAPPGDAASPAPPAGPAAKAPDPSQDDGLTVPPPGSPRDQELWRTATELNNAIPLERGDIARQQWAARNGSYLDRLEAAGRTAPQEQADRLSRLRKRLLDAWTESYQALGEQGRVDPTRACRYELLHFSSAMRAAAEPSRLAPSTLQSDLVLARLDLEGCLQRARAVLERLRSANQQLAGAIADAEAALAKARPEGATAAGEAADRAPARADPKPEGSTGAGAKAPPSVDKR